MSASEISKKIVDELFELGGEHGSPIRRIQFIAGNYPDAEIPQGGMNRIALITFIEERLQAVIEPEKEVDETSRGTKGTKGNACFRPKCTQRAMFCNVRSKKYYCLSCAQIKNEFNESHYGVILFKDLPTNEPELLSAMAQMRWL